MATIERVGAGKGISRAGAPTALYGINPHAGENGLFCEGEEEEKLAPGIERARQKGIDASGPFPADTLFYRASRGDSTLSSPAITIRAPRRSRRCSSTRG